MSKIVYGGGMVKRERGGSLERGGEEREGRERWRKKRDAAMTQKEEMSLPVATTVSAATLLVFLLFLIFFSFSRGERKSPEERLHGPTTRRVVKTVD